MEALHVQPVEKTWGEDEREKSGVSTADEDTDEDGEPEPRPVARRKVSFADAFGLNLVSVKEFDNVEAPESEVVQGGEAGGLQSDEFCISRLFAVPSSPEELDQRLRAQQVELESIELLPGTTTLRGNIRVVNLCYDKSVYARITLDRWNSYFDLLAEYVPGSSDMKTDRFTFMYTLFPPAREGTRVEFCLCYDTAVGTFWSNNRGMNYVLFCNHRGHGPQAQEESGVQKSKRSCLRASRRGSADEKTREATVAKEAPMWGHEAEEAVRKTMDRAEIQSLLYHEEHKPLVDSNEMQHRRERVEHTVPGTGRAHIQVRDFLSQPRQRASAPKPLWSAAAGSLQKRNQKPSNESPQVLTYHQIPLLTLDWNNEKPQTWTADDIWSGGAEKASEERAGDTPSITDMWENFLNGADHAADEEASVCDVWQAFLNGPSCGDHSGVPESEWLQTAASVSPSNDRRPAGGEEELASAAAQLLPASTQRSQTRSVTDTPPECSPGGVTGGDEPSTPHVADLATSPGELRTTETPNAGASDRIPQGARLEGGVTGTAHNAADDTLAFGGTIGAGMKDGEDGITACGVEKKASTGEEIFRPQCEISQRYADETQREESRPKQNRENALKREKNENETGAAQAHADEFNLKQTCQKNIWQSQIMGSELKSDESENNMDGFGRREVETSDRTTREGGIMGETDMIQLLDEEAEEERQTGEGIRLSSSRVIQEERSSSNDTFRPPPTDKPTEVSERRWSHSQEHMKGQIEHVDGEISPREVMAKKDTSAELQRHPETLKGKRDERVSIGKLGRDAAENLQEQSENEGSGELKEHEEGPPRAECGKSPEGTKDPITAENTPPLEVIESGLEEMFIDRFVEDLVVDVLEDVFGQRGNLQGSRGDRNIVGGVAGELRDTADITRDCRLSQKDLNDNFDSGVCSLTELPTDPNLTLDEGLAANRSGELPLAGAEPAPSKAQADSDMSRDLIATSVAQRRRPSSESAAPKGQGNYPRIKGRSEDCVSVHRGRFSQSDQEFKAWWSVVHILSHISRVLTCGLLVAGFFVFMFLYDFPALLALYIS